MISNHIKVHAPPSRFFHRCADAFFLRPAIHAACPDISLARQKQKAVDDDVNGLWNSGGL
ncbi:hypothetical protein [Achromobacter aegrifaciens]|uniref:hypothetical protein n=1 Tax=Achromobacter aegrifaciens TaxID=1287736 RepID=UPI001584454E|nr:hypothetical protein [Achromobacter aegrifaciens]